MTRICNFSAGPSALPEDVLHEIKDELLDYAHTGMSIMEVSHRSSIYRDVIDETEASLRRLIGIPSSYRVLFLQGGASLQFAAIPLNLMRGKRAAYVLSGLFSDKAQREASRYGTVEIVGSSEDTAFDRIPDLGQIDQRISADGGFDYLYICQNNTVYGTMFDVLPTCRNTPLVADVSSCFLSAPHEIERYGLIFAGAQKNAGPAGTTIVIVREDLIETGPACADICPSYMDYRLQAHKGSMFNTPNTFGIYACGKVFSWIERTGGLEAMERRNRAKADLLYRALDESALFHGTADPGSRSITNVTFRTESSELDEAFIEFARLRGIEGLKGHRAIGGLRASLYNAIDLASVNTLVACLHEFEASKRSSMRS